MTTSDSGSAISAAGFEPIALPEPKLEGACRLRTRFG